MVQIATAEQDKLQETSVGCLPLLDEETKGAVIERVEADRVLARSTTLDDNPNMGWKTEEDGLLDEEQARSLVGSEAAVKVIGPFVKVFVNEIDQEKPEDSVKRTFIGTTATIGWLKTA